MATVAAVGGEGGVAAAAAFLYVLEEMDQNGPGESRSFLFVSSMFSVRVGHFLLFRVD